MSTFKVNVTARNPKCEELATQPVEALVDTGSELTWLPADVLKRVGITPRRKRIFSTATQQKVEREVGYAILSAEGYETNDEVVFADPGDLTLLGVRTLEGFGVMVDHGEPVARLVPKDRRLSGALPPEDPLLNLDSFGFDGPRGRLSNAKIDRLIYGG